MNFEVSSAPYKLEENFDWFKQEGKKAMWARLGAALACAFMILEVLILSKGFTFGLFVFMTEWGVWTTALCYMFAGAMYLKPFAENEFVKKAYIVLFAIAFSFEVMITILFWVVLGKAAFDPKVVPTARSKLSMFMDHAVPMACLIADFCCNRIPVHKGDWKKVATFGSLYTIVAFLFNHFAGAGIYPFMTFDSLFTWFAPLFSFIGFPLLTFFALERINQWKLKDN